jgi:hypothetical protein
MTFSSCEIAFRVAGVGIRGLRREVSHGSLNRVARRIPIGFAAKRDVLKVRMAFRVADVGLHSTEA